MAKSGREEDRGCFDLDDWADAYGIESGPARAAKIADLFGVTPGYIREMLRDRRKRPSETIERLAISLKRLADAEAALAQERQIQADQAMAHLANKRDQLTMSAEELMMITRGRDE